MRGCVVEKRQTRAALESRQIGQIPFQQPFYTKGVSPMKTKAKLITMILALLIAGCAFSADWPQYYGPKRDGTSTEKGILRTWPTEGPKVLWTAPLGIGFGGPAISAGKVYLLDRDDKVGDTLRVYDLSNGKELWTFAYAAPGKVEWPGSRTTPTVDGDRVYTVGLVGDLYCFSTTTQKPLWHKNIWTDFGGGSAVPPTPFSPPRSGWPIADMGNRAESVDLRQPADPGLAGAPSGCGRIRQSNR